MCVCVCVCVGVCVCGRAISRVLGRVCARVCVTVHGMFQSTQPAYDRLGLTEAFNSSGSGSGSGYIHRRSQSMAINATEQGE